MKLAISFHVIGFFTHPKVCTCEVLTVHVCRVENRIIWLSTSSFSKNWDIILPLFSQAKGIYSCTWSRNKISMPPFWSTATFCGMRILHCNQFHKIFSVCPKNWQVRKNVWVVPSVKYFANGYTWWFQPDLCNYYLITSHTNFILLNAATKIKLPAEKLNRKSS